MKNIRKIITLMKTINNIINNQIIKIKIFTIHHNLITNTHTLNYHKKKYYQTIITISKTNLSKT